MGKRFIVDRALAQCCSRLLC